jgi:hypothetical protein
MKRVFTIGEPGDEILFNGQPTGMRVRLRLGAWAAMRGDRMVAEQLSKPLLRKSLVSQCENLHLVPPETRP